MMSMACGLAATGKVPYASTFAIFATGRAYDQVRLGIAHNELKVRIGASHGGVSLGEDGASHQMIEDIALMRAMPRMQVVVPADYNQAYRGGRSSPTSATGPMYMRFGRPATPVVYDEIPETLGDGVDVLREGKDISIFACGHMVWRGARGRRVAGARGRGRGRGGQRRDHQAARLRGRARRRSRRPGVAVDRRGAPRRRRPRPTRSARSPPSSTRCRSSRSAWTTSFGVSGTGEACMEHFGLTAARHRRPRPRGAAPEADRLAPADLRAEWTRPALVPKRVQIARPRKVSAAPASSHCSELADHAADPLCADVALLVAARSDREISPSAAARTRRRAAAGVRPPSSSCATSPSVYPGGHVGLDRRLACDRARRVRLPRRAHRLRQVDLISLLIREVDAAARPGADRRPRHHAHAAQEGAASCGATSAPSSRTSSCFPTAPSTTTSPTRSR